MIVLLVGIALIIVVLWLAAVLYVSDFSVPQARLQKFKHALIIFPHADDETNVAGLLWLLRQQGTRITFVVLTKGEKGTPDAHENTRLKAIRGAEMQGVAGRLGSGQLVQEDFGDGELDSKGPELEKYLRALIQQEQPDLVVTYDQAGMYGHPDHLACTAAITKVMNPTFSGAQLWYLAFAPRLWRHLNLPVHMAEDSNFNDRRAKANLRLFVGKGTLAKIRAVYGHQSQRQSFQNMMPLHLPIWLVYSLQIFEYYERVS